ncbi:hypothetical protein JCM18909_2034 [Cutibacterium acnes JCM 18909]|nr:hypothetical protein JCM18909_2034 [Cutibacterium acnes JCM 18909]
MGMSPAPGFTGDPDPPLGVGNGVGVTAGVGLPVGVGTTVGVGFGLGVGVGVGAGASPYWGRCSGRFGLSPAK